MKRYKIIVNGDTEKITNIITKLFALGYVFSDRRLKDAKNLESNGGYIFKNWKWISIGNNKECKMILERILSWNSESDVASLHEEITLQEFLKLPDE